MFKIKHSSSHYYRMVLYNVHHLRLTSCRSSRTNVDRASVQPIERFTCLEHLKLSDAETIFETITVLLKKWVFHGRTLRLYAAMERRTCQVILLERSQGIKR